MRLLKTQGRHSGPVRRFRDNTRGGCADRRRLRQEVANAALPAESKSLSPPPLLLPGEAREKYDLMRQAIFAELAPQTAIEWLLAIDVAELSPAALAPD